jgi:hypothetical protein
MKWSGAPAFSPCGSYEAFRQADRRRLALDDGNTVAASAAGTHDVRVILGARGEGLMQDVPPAPTRRGFLRSALILAAGAVGTGIGLQRASAAAAQAPAGGGSAAVPASVATLTLRGRCWYLTGRGRQAGLPPTYGDRGTAHGDLLDDTGSVSVGTFRAACFHGGRESADLELHTFSLADGTIVGMGAATDGEGTFAIVGGTGRYAGARGAYAARQGVREVGGDGSAEFVFTFVS